MENRYLSPCWPQVSTDRFPANYLPTWVDGTTQHISPIEKRPLRARAIERQIGLQAWGWRLPPRLTWPGTPGPGGAGMVAHAMETECGGWTTQIDGSSASRAGAGSD